MPSGQKTNDRETWIKNSRYAVTVPFEAIKEHLPFFKENNLDIEVMMYDTAWVRSYPESEVREMGELLEAEDVDVSVHGPLFDLNPGSKDKIIRDYTKFSFMRSLNISALLKARIIVFHLGLNPLIPSDYREDWLRISLKTWKPIVNHAKRLGIIIAIENMFLSTPHLLRQVIETVDSPFMKATLDVGHVNVYSTVPLEEWMEALQDYIVKVHINDNDAKDDLHLEFGKGNVDFRKIYRLLQKKKIRPKMTLEMTPDRLPETLKYIKDYKLTIPGG